MNPFDNALFYPFLLVLFGVASATFLLLLAGLRKLYKKLPSARPIPKPASRTAWIAVGILLPAAVVWPLSLKFCTNFPCNVVSPKLAFGELIGARQPRSVGACRMSRTTLHYLPVEWIHFTIAPKDIAVILSGPSLSQGNQAYGYARTLNGAEVLHSYSEGCPSWWKPQPSLSLWRQYYSNHFAYDVNNDTPAHAGDYQCCLFVSADQREVYGWHTSGASCI